ncbi:TPA: hypothetical protein ACGFXZ_001316 [Vibrio cholerae]
MQVQKEPRLSINDQHKDPKPEFGLVFFDSPKGYAVTRHEFHEEQMQGGVIIDTDAVIKLLEKVKDTNDAAKAAQAKEQAKGSEVAKYSLIPQNVLLESDRLLVWHTPATKCPMWYRMSGTHPKALRNVTWTPLLFVLNKHRETLYVFALESDERPTLDTMTYYAPLANVFDSHYLCQGSAPLPKQLSSSNIQEIQDTLYMSAFDGFKHSLAIKLSDDIPDQRAFWDRKNLTGEMVDVANELYPYEKLSKVLEEL